MSESYQDSKLFRIRHSLAHVMAQAMLETGQFEALAVNVGSALTPIGNPQNLFLWQLSKV